VTGRSLALAQALVLVAAGVIVGITTYAVHTVTADWPMTLAVAIGLVLVFLLALLWSSLDLARDRIPRP
jgi:multisubunit Na+/H+ antiporter MnhE subunit